MSDPEKEVRTAGKLRAITAHARAVDAVEVWVYMPNTRGPVKCFIAGYALNPPNPDEANVLALQVRPFPEAQPPPPPEAGGGDIPTESPTPEEPPDRGRAGRRTESVPGTDSTM